MGKPPVNLFGQFLIIFLLENAAVGKRKLGCSGVLAFGNNRNGTLLHSLHDGKPFHFDSGTVDAEVGTGGEDTEFVPCTELAHRLVFQHAILV